MREELGEEGSRAGEGGTDYGDVAFDGGPGCGTDVVVWGVFVSIAVQSVVKVTVLMERVDSHVGSVDMEMIRRPCRRRILVIMTLAWMLAGWWQSKGIEWLINSQST